MNQLCCVLSPIAKVGSNTYCIGHIEALLKIRAEAAFKDPLRKVAVDSDRTADELSTSYWDLWKKITSTRGKIKRRIIKKAKYLASAEVVAKVDQQIVDLRAVEEEAILKKKGLNKKNRGLRKSMRQWNTILKAKMLEGLPVDV